MNRLILKFALYSFIVSTLTSCALTNSVQSINYSPSLTISDKLPSSKQVKLEPMKDERGYDDERIIFYKKNMYSQTMSGTYLAENPVTEILLNAIENGLKEKGIQYNSQHEDLILKSWLIKLDCEAISGFASVHMIPEITVKFQLLDNNNKVIWTDILVGKVKTKGGSFKEFMPPAIDALVMKLVENQAFLNAISTN